MDFDFFYFHRRHRRNTLAIRSKWFRFFFFFAQPFQVQKIFFLASATADRLCSVSPWCRLVLEFRRNINNIFLASSATACCNVYRGAGKNEVDMQNNSLETLLFSVFRFVDLAKKKNIIKFKVQCARWIANRAANQRKIFFLSCTFFF